MTDIFSHPAAPHLPKATASQRAALPRFVGRGIMALVVLALLAGVASQLPVRGDLLGLLSGVAGSLAVAGIITQPERHPLLSLCWSALAFALPVTLTLAHPGLVTGTALTLGAVWVWALVALAASGRKPAD